MRFYDPGRGVIYLDGRRLDSYDKRALRRMLGLVEQEPFFFSDSIKDSICLWEPEDFVRFAGTSAATELLASLPTVDTRLTERGMNLSAGQRQLLSFLRTLAADPAIWILDEAAAHLSPQLDRELTGHVAAHSAGRTVITIAHRLSSVSESDRVAVLYGGKLRELGTQTELLALDGFYARLFRAQAALLEN
jgi:ABC-type multidrug transport system fused ATPase/permease subunit